MKQINCDLLFRKTQSKHSIKSLMFTCFLSLAPSLYATDAVTTESMNSNLTALTASTNQKQTVLKGVVKDNTGLPLIGATVLVDDSQTGTITDIDGNFTIEVHDLSRKANLKISYIGFIEQLIPIQNKREFNIILQENTKELDEVIVIGYGSQRKSDLTGGITSIGSEEINRIPAVSISQRLQGQVAGMNVTSSNSKPGTDASILIRGKKTLKGSTAPLVILDGIPFAGSLSEIDQNSIENITVLKDASSAAIYGARATNGVILVTSKKGKIGTPTVRYSGYIGVQKAERLPKLMNGPEYISFLKDYRKDIGDESWDQPETYLQTALIDNYKNGRTTDWQKELYSSALQMEHQLSVSGASERTNYYISASLTDQNSIIRKAKGYKKYGITSNITQSINEHVKVGVNIQLSERDRGGFEPSYSHPNEMSPYASVRDENGDYVRYPMYTETLYTSPFANYGASIGDKAKSAYLNGFLEIKAPGIKGLSYRANMGYSYRNRDREEYYPTTTLTGSTTNGKALVRANTYGNWVWENIVTYQNSWKKHNLNVTGLYSAEKQYDKLRESSGEDFISDANIHHNLGLAKSMITLKSDYERKQLLGMMARINYSYDSRYLLTLTGRRDGASVYGKGNKWEFFPSVAAAWVLSSEPFFQKWEQSAIEFLKLRLSYGSNGNIYSTPYKSFTKLTDRDYVWGDDNVLGGGLVAGFTFGNPNLKWEKTNTLNFGIDFYLLKDSRISGSIDIYNSLTNNLLMTRTVPVMNGYTSIDDNVGKIQNKGFELSLNSHNIKTKDFNWNTTLTLSRNWDKIKELQKDKDGNKLDDISNKWFIGSPVNVYYDYKVTGVWQLDEAEEAAKYKAVPGDAKLLDANDDGKIDAKDRVVIGSRSPKWLAGLTNTFSYKDVTLSLFFNGVFGQWHENHTLKYERQLFNKNTNYSKEIDYWTPENPSSKYPRLGYKESKHTFYKKVNFIRLQDVNLSYHFPQKLIQKVGIQGLTTYVSARNLFTSSNGKKYTPNLEMDQYNLGGYPTTRAFFFGLDLTF